MYKSFASKKSRYRKNKAQRFSSEPLHGAQLKPRAALLSQVSKIIGAFWTPLLTFSSFEEAREWFPKFCGFGNHPRLYFLWPSSFSYYKMYFIWEETGRATALPWELGGGGAPATCWHPWGGYEEDRDGLFTVVHGGSERDNRHKFKQERLRLNIQNTFSPWDKPSSAESYPEVVQFPSWRLLTNWLDKALIL